MNKFLLVITLIISIISIKGQDKTTPIYLPIVPIIADYEYAPQYFSQWITHPQYSMIEAIVDDNAPPILQIILTETTTKKRIFYTNSKPKAEILKDAGKEVYETDIDYKEIDQQPTFEFTLRDNKGQPIIWRLNYASTPSERGAGLTPVPQFKGLRLEYRELGTAVGEGTAVQIGETVIEAEYWKEISSPPYFTAYRGAVTVGRHLGTLNLGSEKWSVQSQPKELKKGEKWILNNEKNQTRILEVAKDYQIGNDLIVDEIKSDSTLSPSIRIVLLVTQQGYAVRAYQIKSKSKEMQIKFATPLPIHFTDSANFESEFTISQGNTKKVVGGKIVGVREKDSYTKLSWQFSEPDWVKKKVLETMIKFEAGGYSIETMETAK